jgi:hypothetical protein
MAIESNKDRAVEPNDALDFEDVEEMSDSDLANVAGADTTDTAGRAVHKPPGPAP